MLEKHLTQNVRGLALRLGWLFYHTHRSQHSAAGFPDCIMIRGDRLVVAELKVGKNQVTADQWEWLEHFKAITPDVYVWWDTDEDWDEILEVFA